MSNNNNNKFNVGDVVIATRTQWYSGGELCVPEGYIGTVTEVKGEWISVDGKSKNGEPIIHETAFELYDFGAI